ncbi:MAG: T3SS effector HopA1 family protein [Gemmatimonadota bacterium]
MVTEIPGLVRAFRVISPTSFLLGQDRYEVETGDPPYPGSSLSSEAESRLAATIYSQLHCRLTTESWLLGQHVDPGLGREFVESLSDANCGRGTWQGGWRVRAAATDGGITVERYGVEFDVPEAELRHGGSLAPADSVMVRVPGECRHLLTGFYLALGEADDTMAAGDTVRLYWNVRAEGAAALVRELTGRLNTTSVPFWLKLADAPEKYHRADAAVLYVHHRDLARVKLTVEACHAALSSFIRTAVSAFALRLSPGLAAAQDPGNGESFGQHRSRILALALSRSGGDDSSDDVTVTGEVRKLLLADGIDAEFPHCASASRELLDVLHFGT